MAELPMFPLGSVLFPSLLLPLHIFEPRYRALIRDVLDADGEFGVVLIERGAEVGGEDVRTGVGTVARVLETHEFDDGRWAIQTVGTRRILVDEWLPDDPYPRAEVRDHPDPAPAPGIDELVAEATATLRRALARAAELGDNATPATVELATDPVLASYQVAALAPISTLDRQFLLAAPNAETRLVEATRALADAVEMLDLRLGGDD